MLKLNNKKNTIVDIDRFVKIYENNRILFTIIIFIFATILLGIGIYYKTNINYLLGLYLFEMVLLKYLYLYPELF